MTSHDEPVVLWSLQVHGRDVRCLRQPSGQRVELRILLGDEVFLSEVFPDDERLAARADEFRSTLESRGWHDAPHGTAPRAAAPVDAEGGAAHRASDSAKPPAVLVVDDEDAVRSFLRAYLEEADYAVYEATDVDGALSVLDQAHVDAVVLDVRMPDPRGLGRTGLEVLAFIRLQAAFTTVPVMILTGRLLNSAEQDLIRRHHAHLFLKPDGYRKLLQRLDQLTGRRAVRRP